MYSSLHKFVTYTKYWLTAANSKGHGIHSPFVFQFVINVLNDDRFFYAFETIENIVNADLNHKKLNRLFFKIINYYEPNNILLIDEAVGITTSYIALANTDTSIYSYFLQEKNFLKVKEINNIFKIQNCYFINNAIALQQKNDLVYINALNALQLSEALTQVLPILHQQSIIIINNIHSSKAIAAVWNKLQTNSAVTLTIDLFYIGLVFFRPENKIAQHFTIRF